MTSPLCLEFGGAKAKCFVYIDAARVDEVNGIDLFGHGIENRSYMIPFMKIWMHTHQYQ